MNNQNEPNLYELCSRLGNIEGKIDILMKKTDAYGQRINDVARIQDQMVGKISVISAVFGFIGGIIVAILKSKF
jgi:hypothetical protein